MENMNKSSWENVNNQWDNLNDDVVDNHAEQAESRRGKRRFREKFRKF
jgi:hypothetical protein